MNKNKMKSGLAALVVLSLSVAANATGVGDFGFDASSISTNITAVGTAMLAVAVLYAAYRWTRRVAR